MPAMSPRRFGGPIQEVTRALAALLALLFVLVDVLTDFDPLARPDYVRGTRAPCPKLPRRVTVSCPLCSALGQEVVIVAELDMTLPLVIVANLSGCAHAERFGQVGLLTLDEERRLIGAVLDAWEARQG